MTIKGREFDKILSVLGVLQNSMHEFHLTGSRAFNKHRPNSDWDFFTQNSQVMAAWLGNLGFEFLPDATRYSEDQNIAKVLQWSQSHSHEVVQVQLVADCGLKVEAQEMLLCEPIYTAYVNDVYNPDEILSSGSRSYRARKWWRFAFEQANIKRIAQGEK